METVTVHEYQKHLILSIIDNNSFTRKSCFAYCIVKYTLKGMLEAINICCVCLLDSIKQAFNKSEHSLILTRPSINNYYRELMYTTWIEGNKIHRYYIVCLNVVQYRFKRGLDKPFVKWKTSIWAYRSGRKDFKNMSQIVSCCIKLSFRAIV